MAPAHPLPALLIGGSVLVAVYTLAALLTGLVRPSRLRRLIAAAA
jgi:hypothetical protein